MKNFHVDEDSIVIVKRCPLCGDTHKLNVSRSAYQHYIAGALIQDAFPALSEAEREFVMTGFCEKCQKALFESSFE